MLGGRLDASGARSLALGALVAVGLSTGCDPGPQHFAMVFDPCAPLVLEPAPDTTPEQRASIEDAIAMWNDVALVQLTLEPDPDARALPIRFTDSELYMGRFDDTAGEIALARRVTERNARAVVLAHELGHAFNLYHVDDEERVSVMNEGNVDVPPNAGDAAALEGVWGDCVRTGPDVVPTDPVAR